MIKIIVGGVGSGKTITAVKSIIQRREFVFCNFALNNYPDHERLKVEHIVKEIVTENPRGKPTVKYAVNWEFWKNLIESGKKFDIYIDEAHNIINSRRGMKSFSICFIKWLTQIRKILGESEKNHIYFITQRITSVDIVVRELAYNVTWCFKIEKYINNEKKVYIFNYNFSGYNCLYLFNYFLETEQTFRICKRSYFLANRYFKFYNSYELIEFNEVYL